MGFVGVRSVSRVAVLLTVLLVGTTLAKKFTRCSLAKALKGKVPDNQLAMWVCIAVHESSLNTQSINKNNADGSWDHGLFQLNDRYWIGRSNRGGECNLSGKEVRDDDIGNDVKCAKKIYEKHQRISGNGFNAWAAYSRLNHCHGDVRSYIKGC